MTSVEQDNVQSHTVDLVVLGAFLGSGSSAGVVTRFLMCAYNGSTDAWKAVCACSNRKSQLAITHLMRRVHGCHSIPAWLDVVPSMRPDFVMRCVRDAPVWEVAGVLSLDDASSPAGSSSSGIVYMEHARMTQEKTWIRCEASTSIRQLRQLHQLHQLCQYAASCMTSKWKAASSSEHSARNKGMRVVGVSKSHGTALSVPVVTCDMAERIRSSCKHGAACYRNNPEHCMRIAHPGDPDFVSSSVAESPSDAASDSLYVVKDAVAAAGADPNGDYDYGNGECSGSFRTAPHSVRERVCQFDGKCYRKNPKHFQEYAHPKQYPRASAPPGSLTQSASSLLTSAPTDFCDASTSPSVSQANKYVRSRNSSLCAGMKLWIYGCASLSLRNAIRHFVESRGGEIFDAAEKSLTHLVTDQGWDDVVQGFVNTIGAHLHVVTPAWVHESSSGDYLMPPDAFLPP